MKTLFAVMVYVLAFAALGLSQTDPGNEPDPKLTEVWENEPRVVTPNRENKPPSDAIILLGGKNASEWVDKDGGEVKWKIGKGALTVVKGAGDITTKRAFGDVQLHIEWRTPEKVSGEGQGRGNSGVFLQSRYEVQVLDSYNNRTYSNGQAGSIYKQYIPLVNASRKPGEWQIYDIVFIAPRFKADGALESPGWMTVFHNGVLIQNHIALKGETVYRGQPSYKPHALKEPLKLQDHGNPVSFRNIWIREL
jgi:hypothetical protein